MFENIIQTALSNNIGCMGIIAQYHRQYAMLVIASNIENSIQDPFRRMEFAGQALKDIQESETSDDISESLHYWMSFSEDVRPSPRGSLEIWGSVLQEVFGIPEEI
jgi:hypothetical protein